MIPTTSSKKSFSRWSFGRALFLVEKFLKNFVFTYWLLLAGLLIKVYNGLQRSWLVLSIICLNPLIFHWFCAILMIVRTIGARFNLYGGHKMNDAMEKWSTWKEVQGYLGVGRDTVLQWISKRNMPAYKVGRLWKFKLSEVDAWFRSGGATELSVSVEEE